MTPAVEGVRSVRYPLGGPCVVCGFPATQLVIYPECREVWHMPGRGGPCRLPNPPVVGVVVGVPSVERSGDL
jgi:hypothetical protein